MKPLSPALCGQRETAAGENSHVAGGDAAEKWRQPTNHRQTMTDAPGRLTEHQSNWALLAAFLHIVLLFALRIQTMFSIDFWVFLCCTPHVSFIVIAFLAAICGLLSLLFTWLKREGQVWYDWEVAFCYPLFSMAAEISGRSQLGWVCHIITVF